MIKQMIAVILILLAGGAWLLLDCLNRREKSTAEMMQQSIVQARSEAKKRADYKKNFDEQLTHTLNTCNAAADKAKVDYMALVDQAAPRKRGQALIPQAVAVESEKILVAAKAECQLAYDSRLKNGV